MNTITVQKSFFTPKNNYQRKVIALYDLLVENFSQTFFVGGSVRNLIWQTTVTDFDIATAATPKQIIKLLATAGYQVDVSAVRLGVLSVIIDHKPVQLATFRTEVYSGSRFPKIRFSKSMLRDAKRRDFTINTLYFNPKNKKISDPLNSFKDVTDKLLRSVGNPRTKFKEDPLRIVRAWRFAKTYRLAIEPATYEAMVELHQLVNRLSETRIKQEINLCASQNVKKFLLKKFV